MDISKYIFILSLIIWAVIRRYFQRKVDGEKTIKTRRSLLDQLFLVFVVLAMQGVPLTYLLTSWLSFADYDLPDEALYLGIILAISALWLFYRSHKDLGQNWSVNQQLREGHTLVTQGVYKRIRHPMYAAFWLWGLAQALLLANWIAGFGFLAVFAVFYFIRVSDEEAMMLEHFGEEYECYKKRTGRVIPKSIFNHS